MTGGPWAAGLSDWYGPATPVVRRFRSYRPNRRGAVTLARWSRVVFLRAFACFVAALTVPVAVEENLGLAGWQRALMGAGVLAVASWIWRCSLIRVVLRPGEIVRFGVWRHTVIPAAAVRTLHRESFRGSLTLETYGGETVDFFWFEKSLWDVVYDFSAVCEDAMAAHARLSAGRRGAVSRERLRRRFTWSVGGELLAASALVCVVAGLVAGAVR
ncbi:hypothetical protein ACFWA6_05000 [Streptomyces sp. NPDC060020]|uniref:hypothetical protein n=1 Tax=Streptomyces sp. NPDC060020 TaxID=3347038 RepID=UPI0036C80B94